MEAKTVLVCLFVCVYFGGSVAQVASICRPNERLLVCGCPSTCRDPAPECKGVCKFGCFCEEGEVRNDEGICVKLSKCPPIAAPYKLDTSEPRSHGGICAEDEEYRFCEPCNRTCDNPNPMCPAQCAKGCFCKGELLRDKDGRCVKFEECSNRIEYVKEREKNVGAPIPYRFSSGRNQVYRECQKCTQSCSDPEPVCGQCKTGCLCKDGFVTGPDGKCVRKEDCPKAEVTFIEPYTSIEECAPGEQFYPCGCEPSCGAPAPACPSCTRGCLCRAPLVRHAGGRCVPRDQCGSEQCRNRNEIYACKNCERRCNSDDCSSNLTRRCTLGCYCRGGMLRNELNQCVGEHQCYNNTFIVIA